jgi:serine/threonine protein kinase
LKPRGGSKRPSWTSLNEATKVADPEFLDLIERCLRWMPTERLTAEQFLEHPWIKRVAETPIGLEED